MPIRDAIRTSVLSKKWRLNYLTIPQLVFDDQFCKELVDSANKKKTQKFFNYQLNETVTNSLMLHPGRIERFKVCIPKFSTVGYPNVNKWMLYLSTKNIKKLTLEYKKNFVRHKLPPYFFSCLDLTYLKLRNFDFSPPPEFKGFLYLEKLVFFGVHLANNCFESFLSSCPLLQKLHVSACSGVRHFNIIGSKLKVLSIKADDKFESISLENAPNLTKVTVALERAVIGLEDNPIANLGKFGDCLAKVKLLRLNGKFLQASTVA
ncbi:F-box/FBD/LRR-repeat protein At1g13570-like [Nicotiana sylvestris]|uniref:F-box/FBD/LRR-repeat protein At1g13570-like n=1 Tax=Nicotiana sylvestris TaxID=4096 RepID=A0A1U7X2U3_NICSY|nr:PREDICTED: F-box/FBD/LRR-repeat protein At1g13570-like [Nicotiana sylvestris]